MKKSWSLLFPVACCAVGNSLISTPATAQISADGTTNTTVNSDGSGNFTIEQGDRAGNNLFHSFGDFSVPTNGSTVFNNAADVSNIFNRVTGGNISNIDGLIRANGSANLFLVNPAGILFGNNARLDIGGSFFGTTADSILFEEGEFSATDFDNPPLLTVNAPIGLNFRDNPGEITNRSTADGVGLQASPGETIGLIGGDINLEGGLITAPGGRVELSGLFQAGTISLDENIDFGFSEAVEKADISLSEQAAVNVSAGGGGFINVNGRNVTLSEQSELFAGIAENMGSPNAQAGDITINATESVRLLGQPRQNLFPGSIGDSSFEAQITEITARDNATGIRNNVGLSIVRRNDITTPSNAMGSGGNIEINTQTLELSNLTVIDAGVFGQGNGGNIIVNASEVTSDQGILTTEVQGIDTDTLQEQGRGDAGDISINTQSLSLTNASLIFTSIRSEEGNGGDVNIQVSDTFSQNTDSFILTQLGRNAEGSAGNINITAGSYEIGERGTLPEEGSLPALQSDSQPDAQGDAGNISIDVENKFSIDGNLILTQVQAGAEGTGGDITITAGSFEASDGSLILADTKGIGNAGNITISVDETISLDGNNTKVLTEIGQNAIGNAGDIDITANSLNINNGADIAASTIGEGDAGNITISVDETVSLDGNGTKVLTEVGQNAIGNAGDIDITANSLNINNGANIVASTNGKGNAGNIEINTTDNISFSNNSEISSLVGENGVGNGGNISLTTDNGVISLFNEAKILSLVNGNAAGNGGDITLTSAELNLTNNTRIIADTTGVFLNEGEISTAGDININVSGDINLDNSNQIQSQTRGDAVGNAGNLEIKAGGSLISTNGNLILADSQATGNGGNITINVGEQIRLEGISEGGFPSQIVVGLGESSEGTGGNLEIEASELILEDVAFISSNTTLNSIGKAGNITLNVNNLSISENAFINVFTANDSDGGAVTINSQTLNLASGGKVLAATDGDGNAGNINLNISEQIKIDNSIQSSAEFIDFGENLQLLNDLQDSPSGIYANTTANSTGNGGNVDIGFSSGVAPQEFIISNGGQIIVNSEGMGVGGGISLMSQALELNNGSISASTQVGQDDSNTLQSGSITLEIADNVTLENNSLISAQAFGNADGGNLTIDTNFVVAFPNEISGDGSDIIASAEAGNGGNITITAESLLGIEPRTASAGNETNDIDADSESGLDGTISIFTPDTSVVQGVAELPNNLVEPTQTVAQACSNNQGVRTASSFVINGKGGIPPTPEAPMNSEVITVNGATAANSAQGHSISTGIGEITPARGVIKTPDGRIVLTATPVAGKASRTPNGVVDCG